MFLMFCVCNIFLAYVNMGVCEHVCSCVRVCVCVYVCVCLSVWQRESARAREGERVRNRLYARTCAPTHMYRYQMCFCVYVCIYLYSVLCIFSLSFLYRSGAVSARWSFRIPTYIYLDTYVCCIIFLSVPTCPSYSRSTLSPFPPVCLILRFQECIRKEKKSTVPTLLFYITSIFVNCPPSPPSLFPVTLHIAGDGKTQHGRKFRYTCIHSMQAHTKIYTRARTTFHLSVFFCRDLCPCWCTITRTITRNVLSDQSPFYTKHYTGGVTTTLC